DPSRREGGLLILPEEEEILRGAKEGCLFYQKRKRSFAALWRAACSTNKTSWRGSVSIGLFECLLLY
ncbi:MAG: hypothetical protein ACPGWR_25120, partial [Ardenticatenaceae bacterium]